MHEETTAVVSQYQVYLAGAIFLLTYAVIVSEKTHRTLAALMGGTINITKANAAFFLRDDERFAKLQTLYR